MSSIDKKLLTTTSFPPVNASFYFASADRTFCEVLDRQLAPLKQNKRIQTWDEWKILAGQEMNQERDHHLSTDRLLILLISPDFLASELCVHQMEVALQRYQSGDATVIPILVRPCMWQETALKTLQMLPREQKPWGGSSLSEEAWQEIATEIRQVIDSIQRWAFLAYAPEDGDIVERLHRDFALSGVRLWSLEREQLFADFSQNREMRTAMINASIVLLITSPITASSYAVKAQMNLAADYQRPVIVVWARGEDQEQPYAEAWHAEEVIDARGEHYETALTILEARLKQQGRLMLTAPKALLFPPTESRNPYKGLHAFTAEDARDFFGREALVRELTTVLEQILVEETKGKHSARMLTVLLGASGSGKSSVVMAGLLPFLQRQGIANSQEWIYLEPMRPGNHPLEALASALAQHPALHTVGNTLSFSRTLASDSLRTLHLLSRQLVGSSSRKVVLFIDQFEEVFTLTDSEEERKRFFDLLVTAVTEPQGPLLVLLTLRADFYDRPMQYRELYDLLEAHRVAVLPMEREDLRRVIEGPAQLPDVQLTFDENLVGDLLFEVRDQGASLPLLQFTLDQLFERRNGHRLTRQAYEEIGGVKGALVKHAEKTYANLLSEEHQKLAQFLFVRLIEPGETQQEMTRRRMPLSTFSLPDPRLTRLLEETMEAFVAARLLTTNEIAGIKTIEVSHEALLREWPRCAQWVRDTREKLPFQQTLSKDVAQWEQLGKPKERLYYGSQLKTMKKRVDRSFLNRQEIDFLYASAAHQRQQWIRMIALLLLPVIVLGLVLTPLLVFRPTWCPSWLCPAPQVRALLDKGGTHDSNLQVTFQTLQSSFKILPVALSAYTLGTATPDDAQLIDTSQSLPYRVILKIHSLQQGRYGLVIDRVALLINKEAQVIPYPLRVVIKNNVLIYNNNLYRATYRGQGPGALLTALYVVQPLEFVSLVPGETDEISLEVRSTVVADLHFQVQVTYHVIGELASRSLTLPNPFEIIFSDRTNWHPYQIQAGHLVAA
jgi:Novel STAND NTPase 1/TIR domain